MLRGSTWLIATLGLLAVEGALAGPRQEAGFSAADRAAIQAFYREAGPAPGKGHAGRKSKPLPPGIARNLARGKPLPPGLATRPVPRDLLVRLDPPRGCEVVWVDGRIILVEVATRLVRDVIEDAVLR